MYFLLNCTQKVSTRSFQHYFTSQDRVKLSMPPPPFYFIFKGLKLFVPPPSVWLNSKLPQKNYPNNFSGPLSAWLKLFSHV